jgi:uncharacterized protein YqeY
MRLAQQVDQDLIRALKERDATTTATLRLLKSAAKYAEVAKRAELSDEEFIDVVNRQAKLRREAAHEFDRGGRPDRANQERAELAVLQAYLPEQLDEEAVRELLQEAIKETGASGPDDIGRVMSRVMPSVRGRADGARVNALARELLSRSAG